MQDQKIKELTQVQSRVRDLLGIGFGNMTQAQSKEFQTLSALQKKLMGEIYTFKPLSACKNGARR